MILLFFVVVLAARMITHELAHLMVGFLFNVIPLEISFGEGPEIRVWSYRGVRVKVSLIPFGGHVRWAWRNRKPWKNILATGAGPVVDLFWIWVILFVAYDWDAAACAGVIYLIFYSQRKDWRNIVAEFKHKPTKRKMA